MSNKCNNLKDMQLFSHGRTALKYGLLNLGLNYKNEILLPKFICDVVLHPIKQLGIGYRFYSIFDDLKPDWDDIENKINEKTSSIMMVNYFGQAQNINSFIDFCKKHNLFLIEDNAHGFGGELNGQIMGTFGDISFSSPRKFLNTSTGGALWIKKQNNFELNKISDYPITFYRRMRNKFFKKNILIKNILKKILLNCPNYKNPRLFRENPIDNYRIDFESENIYEKTNWNLIKSFRRNSYINWESFAKKIGLKPVYSNLQPGANPWCFPAYANNQSEAIKWFRWGWKNNLSIFPWPVLPEEIIVENKGTFKRWSHLICFSTEHNPPE